jgi:hypothetical protein
MHHWPDGAAEKLWKVQCWPRSFWVGSSVALPSPQLFLRTSDTDFRAESWFLFTRAGAV